MSKMKFDLCYSNQSLKSNHLFKIIEYFFVLTLCLLIPSLTFAQSVSAALELYKNGNIQAAKEEFQNALKKSESDSKPAEIWNVLISYAWFLDEIGEHRQAIEHSNRALEIAAQSNNQFMIGRSLSWLGWAYTGLGLYELALDFYKNAAEIAAPKGKITLLNVWGLSTQEIGALYYKMGRVSEGRKYLEQALNVAREYKVGPGISEGASHLAELSLTEGKHDEAEALAREAVKFGEECRHGCTPYNTMHARVILSRVLFEKAKLNPTLSENAMKEVRTTLEASEKAGLKRCVAEAKLLLAKSLPASQFEERYKLSSEALEILANMESEVRGSAESELGKLFLDNGDLKLAEFYLKNGFRINKELFRKIDNAYIQNDLAAVSSLAGKKKRSLNQLKKSLDAAFATNNLTLASEVAAKLSSGYLELGYTALALKTAKKGLTAVDSLILQTADETLRNAFRSRKIELSATFGQASLEVIATPSTAVTE